MCNNTVGSYICEDLNEFKAQCEVTVSPPTTTTAIAQRPCHRGFERDYKGDCIGKNSSIEYTKIPSD